MNDYEKYLKYVSVMAEGNTVDGIYILTDCNICKTSAGKTYLAGKISDSSGSIILRMWNYNGSFTRADTGIFVYITGTVSSYSSNLQVIAEELKPIDRKDIPESEMERLIPYAKIDSSERMQYIWDEIEKINDSDLYNITKYLITKYEQEFYTIPAAKSIHHACVHGLLQHTSDMLLSAESLCDIYEYRISKSLLISGVILHDIGKIKEFSICRDTGLVSDYSLSGLSLGHSILGVMEIEDAAKAVNAGNTRKLLLQNIVASHHGSPEYGAAKTSCVLEADIVHALDMIDSRAEIVSEEPSNYEAFSPIIKALGKSIYKHTIDFEPDRIAG